MAYAYDFNEVPGPPASEIKANEGAGVLTYGTGTQQSPDYLTSLEDAGLHAPLIWEHNTDSILGGWAYGVDECKAWEATHRPGLVYLACDLNDGALGGRSVVPFCAGWCSVTRENAVGLYGPDAAILEAQRSGIAKLSRWWGVVNWLDGGHADNDPRNIARWREIGAHLVQLIGSPIPNTDQNLILDPAWWTTGGAPTPEDDDMKPLYISKQSAPGLGIWVTDGQWKRHVLPDEWAFVTFTGGGPPPLVALSDAWWDSIPTAGVGMVNSGDIYNIAHATAALVPPGAGGSGGPLKVNLTGSAVPG